MPSDPPDALPTSEAVVPFPAGLPASEASLALWRNAPTPLGDVLGWVEALLRAQLDALAFGSDAAIRKAMDRFGEAEFSCGDYDDEDPGTYKSLVELARNAKGTLLLVIAAQRAAEAKRVAADATQRYVDWVCHYRNLAIVLGAKPEQMVSSFDRDLCRRGLSVEEAVLSEVPDVWEQLEAAEKEAARVREEALDAIDRYAATMDKATDESAGEFAAAYRNMAIGARTAAMRIRALREAPRG